MVLPIDNLKSQRKYIDEDSLSDYDQKTTFRLCESKKSNSQSRKETGERINKKVQRLNLRLVIQCFTKPM